MKRLAFTAAMILGASSAVLAQADRNLRDIRTTPVSQADLKNLAGWLMQVEWQERNELMPELHRLDDLARTNRQQFEKEIANNQKLKDLIKGLPAEIDRESLQKELPNIPLNIVMPKPQHASGNPFRDPPDRPAVPTSPPQLPVMAEKNPTVRNLLKLWEKNVGPLDKTPTLKRIFADLLRNSVNNGDAGVSGPFSDDAFNSFFNPDSPAGHEIGEMLEEAANGSSWKWADLGLDDWKFNLPQSQSYSAGSTSWTPPSESGGSLPILDLLLALAALAIGVIVLRRISGIRASSAGSQAVRASDPPLDPNAIHDRASLVKAFEAVTLNVMGREAAAWNHCTIAAELNRRVVVASGTAAEAARLYEFARYAPPSEPLPSESIAQARRCLVLLGEAAAQ